MQRFRAGQKFKIHRNWMDVDTDKWYEVDEVDPHGQGFYFRDDAGDSRRVCGENLDFVIFEGSIPTKGGTMQNIVKKIKDLALSKDDRLLREQGITDDCGQLTEEGRQVLEQVVFAAHKGAVVTLVQNVADAEKAEKKKK